eukprot:scaffold300_cov258-Pinguiococcus_pyrenoidosus.AAC.35
MLSLRGEEHVLGAREAIQKHQSGQKAHGAQVREGAQSRQVRLQRHVRDADGVKDGAVARGCTLRLECHSVGPSNAAVRGRNVGNYRCFAVKQRGLGVQSAGKWRNGGFLKYLRWTVVTWSSVSAPRPPQRSAWTK